MENMTSPLLHVTPTSKNYDDYSVKTDTDVLCGGSRREYNDSEYSESDLLLFQYDDFDESSILLSYKSCICWSGGEQPVQAKRVNEHAIELACGLFLIAVSLEQKEQNAYEQKAEEILYGIWERLQYESSIVTYRYDIFQEQFLSIVASHTHRSVCQAIQFLPHLPFITPVDVFQVTSAGGVYKDDSLGISITVPEGAVPELKIFPIEVGISLYGPFQFPKDSTRIAPILMLCPQKNIPLKKPITVTLPHLLTEATKSDIESFNIRVVKADHKSLLFLDFDLNKCLFEDIDPCESCISFDNRTSITFSVSHFCFLSVLGDLKMNAPKIGYCVYPLIRRDMNVISYRLCVTFLMAPFIKEFVKQFSKHGYEVLQRLSPKSISFKHKQSNIKAYIEKGISQPGWLVCLSYTDYGDVQVISAESVLDVLEKEASAVETDIQLLMYPPSIQINANGQQATAPANVKVHFKTSESKEFCWTLPLDLAPSEAVLGERTSLEQPLTLDLLLSKYTLDLHIKKRIKPEDRAILAQKFHYKKTLCFVDYIGLNASRQSDVSTAQHQFGAAAAMTTALELWSSMNPYRATFKNLLLYLLEQTEGEIAEAVCDYLFKQANKVEKCAKQVHHSNETLESDESR